MKNKKIIGLLLVMTIFLSGCSKYKNPQLKQMTYDEKVAQLNGNDDIAETSEELDDDYDDDDYDDLHKFEINDVENELKNSNKYHSVDVDKIEQKYYYQYESNDNTLSVGYLSKNKKTTRIFNIYVYEDEYFDQNNKAYDNLHEILEIILKSIDKNNYKKTLQELMDRFQKLDKSENCDDYFSFKENVYINLNHYTNKDLGYKNSIEIVYDK